MSLRSAPSAPSPKKIAEPVISEPVIPVTAGPNTLREVLQKADVLLHVVDARDPAAGISEALFKEATGKDVLLLVNKIGTFFVLSALRIEPISPDYQILYPESLWNNGSPTCG